MPPVNIPGKVSKGLKKTNGWSISNPTPSSDNVSRSIYFYFYVLAFDEDKEILEAIQEEELSPSSRKPVRLAIDKAPNVYRLRIKKMAANH